ncbi:MAG: hypothetical protein WBA12_03885 [Catalinimonas sp.]
MLQKRFGQVVRKYFPAALDTRETSITYLGMLQNGHQMDVSRLLMATSLCSDDINVPSTNFFRVVLGPFFLGGLGGLPFAGKTGMSAFAHHIPDGGAALIFYGPHIGVTLEEELGQMYRSRQERSGACCGALMLTLQRFCQPNFKPEIVSDDYQQTVLEQTLFPYREEILNDPLPERAITEAAFRAIDDQVHGLIRATKEQFKAERIALLGGIIVNTDYGVDDYFDVRNFEVISTRHL